MLEALFVCLFLVALFCAPDLLQDRLCLLNYVARCAASALISIPLSLSKTLDTSLNDMMGASSAHIALNFWTDLRIDEE